MYRASVDRLRLDADLRASLDADDFVALFQPIVALADGRPIGFEALLRWRRADQGLVLPASFIPASEQNGLIGRMGQRVLEQSLKALAGWRALGPDWQHLSVHVNVSPVQLATTGLAEEIAACLQRHDLPGEALVVEITESSLLEASQQILDTLDRLRALQVRLHLDDFGTGYGFLTHLRELPITAMKIDRSFTAALPGDRAATAIVASLIQLAHGLGLEVVAEGVEQPAQLAFLREQGCNFAQGFWLCRPVPAEAVDAAWLERLRGHGAPPEGAAAFGSAVSGPAGGPASRAAGGSVLAAR
jgi:EAL domain-containing protein (putative c-di-GMP-specific phosphodiesterase class I)